MTALGQYEKCKWKVHGTNKWQMIWKELKIDKLNSVLAYSQIFFGSIYIAYNIFSAKLL